MRSRGLRHAAWLGAVAVVIVSVPAAALLLAAPGRPGVDPRLAALRAMRTVATRVAPAIDNQGHLYVLDGWGGVHPVGASPRLATSAAWPDRDIAFSLALFPDGTGGYVMDGWGKLHPVGNAPAVDSGVYWPHWIGAREIVMAPWSSSSDPAGYLLDADGGIHPFGGAPAVTGNAVWPGVDKVRGLVLNLAATSNAVQGYTLDFSGGIHAFGGAPAVTASATWPGRDVADSIVAWTAARSGSPGGWVLDRQGGVHPYGSAPALIPSATWPGWDIARGLAGAGSGGGSTENLVLQPQAISDSWGAYFNQRDVRWAARGVGLGSPRVWQVGCLLTDLAMVYSHFGFGSVSPATVAAHGGWFDGRGDMYNSALHVPGHTTVVMWRPSSAWISAQVAAGHPVIVGMNLSGGGTHFVTLTGMNGSGDYWTDDPWEQNAMHVTFSGDWSDRRPIYEAIAFV